MGKAFRGAGEMGAVMGRATGSRVADRVFMAFVLSFMTFALIFDLSAR
jgi:hypothetical protein